MTAPVDRSCPPWCEQPAGHLFVEPAGPGDYHISAFTVIDLPQLPGLRDTTAIQVAIEQYITARNSQDWEGMTVRLTGSGARPTPSTPRPPPAQCWLGKPPQPRRPATDRSRWREFSGWPGSPRSRPTPTPFINYTPSCSALTPRYGSPWPGLGRARLVRHCAALDPQDPTDSASAAIYTLRRLATRTLTLTLTDEIDDLNQQLKAVLTRHAPRPSGAARSWPGHHRRAPHHRRRQPRPVGQRGVLRRPVRHQPRRGILRQNPTAPRLSIGSTTWFG